MSIWAWFALFWVQFEWLLKTESGRFHREAERARNSMNGIPSVSSCSSVASVCRSVKSQSQGVIALVLEGRGAETLLAPADTLALVHASTGHGRHILSSVRPLSGDCAVRQLPVELRPQRLHVPRAHDSSLNGREVQPALLSDQSCLP